MTLRPLRQARHVALRWFAVIAIATITVGWAIGQIWATIAIVTMALLAWNYWQMSRLLDRLASHRRLNPSVSHGLWRHLENLVEQRQRQHHSRTKRLLQLLRNYRHAAAAIPDAALIVDRATGQMHWFNRQARRQIGLHYPHSLGSKLVTAIDHPRVHDWMANPRTDEALLDIPSPADANTRLSLRLIPLTDAHWLVIIRDITKLMRLEQVRRDFVANVSHELRTPLTVVHGYLDMIEPDDYPDLRHILEEMRKQSARMSQLVEDLLTLSRLEAQEHLAEERVSMRSMLQTLRREAEALSQGRHRVVVEQLTDTDLLGSTRELHSAFSNLVSNAVRYTPTGGSITIRFSELPHSGVALSVIDTGYGIPEQHLPRLTERFYRVSSSRARETGGTGLGLSIVKHVLNLHDGQLEIDSEVGRGSIFTCRFGPLRMMTQAKTDELALD